MTPEVTAAIQAVCDQFQVSFDVVVSVVPVVPTTTTTHFAPGQTPVVVPSQGTTGTPAVLTADEQSQGFTINAQGQKVNAQGVIV